MSRILRRTTTLGVVIVCMTFASGCAPVIMNLEPQIPVCRTSRPADAMVTWITPYDGGDRARLRLWCDPVGPVVLRVPENPVIASATTVTVISWNTGVGEGDLDAMLDTLAASRLPLQRHVVLLLQETYRQHDVPERCPARSGVASRLPRHRPAGRVDVVGFAMQRRMFVAYVPSMRNGRDCHEWPREDRGNAVLSTLPLSQVTAIELPFAQQRRVAVAASIRIGDDTLRVMSVHLDTVFGHRKQARGIANALQQLGWDRDVLVAGDFNAWWLDSRVALTDHGFVDIDCSRRSTRITGRLDRMFRRSDDLRPLKCWRAPVKFGSDHVPLIAEIDFGV